MPPQRPQLAASQGIGAGRPILEPSDVHGGVFEVDLVPSQVDDFSRPQAVPKGQEHHEGERAIRSSRARPFPAGAPYLTALEAALRRAARLSVVSAEHFPGFWVNEVHLRADRAIHRHKHARVRSLVFLRDETLHPVPGGGALEQESWHVGAINLVPETPTPAGSK